MKLISEILKCTAKKGNISNLARGGFSENFIKKFNFRRPPIIPLVPGRYRILHLSFILHMSVPRRWLGVLRWSEVAAEVT